MYVCMYTCMYVCIYMYVCVCARLFYVLGNVCFFCLSRRSSQDQVTSNDLLDKKLNLLSLTKI